MKKTHKGKKIINLEYIKYLLLRAEGLTSVQAKNKMLDYTTFTNNQGLEVLAQYKEVISPFIPSYWVLVTVGNFGFDVKTKTMIEVNPESVLGF